MRPALALLAALLLLTGFRGPAATRAAAPARPNVLFVISDDLNDWLGCLRGHPQVRTPNLDRLARRSVLFTNAHCQAPLCNPSRTSFLTGLRPSTTGVYALQPWFRSVERLRDHVTMPQHFARHGYRTLATGKVWHDGYPKERADGGELTAWGFGGTFGPLPARKFVQTPEPHPLVDWGVYPERDEEQDDWKVADWAVRQIRQIRQSKPGGPWFLSVGFRRPHVPCYAGQKWFDLYPEEKLQLPPVKADDREDTPRFSWYLHWKLPEPRLAWLQRAGQWKPLVRSYLASVSFMDSQVGRLLEALERSGQADRTIIVFTSDHGWHLGEKGITGKNSLWDRSTRVPLLIAGPGVQGGWKCRRPAELVDLYPTLAALCGLPQPAGLDGRSLLPQLRDPSAPREHPAITTQGPGNHAVRDERWRYIRYADGSEELYDCQNDPNEWNNLAGSPRHAARMRELSRWLPARDALPAPGSVARLIEVRNGVPHWETKPIRPGDPIPMDD